MPLPSDNAALHPSQFPEVSSPITSFPSFEPEKAGSKWFRNAPLIVAGILILILGGFGIFLWNDFNKLVPEETSAPQPPPEGAGPAPETPTPTPTPPSPPTATGAMADPPVSTTAAVPPVPPKGIPGPANLETAAPPKADSPEEGAGNVPLVIEPAVPLANDEPGSDRNTDTTGLLDPPIEALQSFLNAPDWQTRIDHTLHAEAMRPLMESYYLNHPDRVVVPSSIRFQHSESDPETNHRFYVFHLTTEEAPDGFPVLIEETENGLKVDWVTFVEFKDNLFHEFAANPSEGKTGTFHVIMRNAHYFGKEFPELSDFTSYRLDPPIPDQEAFAFARTDSLVNKTLQKQVTWGMNFTPFLELRWAKSQDGTDFLQIVRLLHTNWRNREP